MVWVMFWPYVYRSPANVSVRFGPSSVRSPLSSRSTEPLGTVRSVASVTPLKKIEPPLNVMAPAWSVALARAELLAKVIPPPPLTSRVPPLRSSVVLVATVTAPPPVPSLLGVSVRFRRSVLAVLLSVMLEPSEMLLCADSVSVLVPVPL